MSPQQVTGEPLTGASDQFSLGITLYELLCGRRPYEGETPLETMELIRAAAPPPLEGLAPELKEVIGRLLAPEPGQRFPDDDAMLEALGRCRRLFPMRPDQLGRWVQEEMALSPGGGGE